MYKTIIESTNSEKSKSKIRKISNVIFSATSNLRTYDEKTLVDTTVSTILKDRHTAGKLEVKEKSFQYKEHMRDFFNQALENTDDAINFILYLADNYKLLPQTLRPIEVFINHMDSSEKFVNTVFDKEHHEKINKLLYNIATSNYFDTRKVIKILMQDTSNYTLILHIILKQLRIDISQHESDKAGYKPIITITNKSLVEELQKLHDNKDFFEILLTYIGNDENNIQLLMDSCYVNAYLIESAETNKTAVVDFLMKLKNLIKSQNIMLLGEIEKQISCISNVAEKTPVSSTPEPSQLKKLPKTSPAKLLAQEKSKKLKEANEAFNQEQETTANLQSSTISQQITTFGLLPQIPAQNQVQEKPATRPRKLCRQKSFHVDFPQLSESSQINENPFPFQANPSSGTLPGLKS